jgi:alkylation response protein AidB-like acyl-CoA dehydrogenase
MDFALDAEQTALRKRVLEFAATLGAQAEQHDHDATFDRDGWRSCASFGVLGWAASPEYGGAGLDPVSLAVAYEALGRGCADNGLVFAINNHVFACLVYLIAHGTPAQRRRFVPRLCSGEMIGAHAITEYEAGSDILAMRTRAARTPGGYRLSGSKAFISNGPVADLYIIFARTSSDGPAQSALTAFIVPRDSPGLTVTREIQKLGLRGAPMGEITLDEVRVPAELVLGSEGDGYRIFMACADWERGFMSASQVGVLERLLTSTVAFARSRQQFGRPIGEYQGVREKVADMRVRLELARLLLYKVAWLKARDRIALPEAGMLKLYVSEALKQTALDALQIHGARGYTTESAIERELRDVLGGTVWGGTSEMQRSLIAGVTGLPRPVSSNHREPL